MLREAGFEVSIPTERACDVEASRNGLLLFVYVSEMAGGAHTFSFRRADSGRERKAKTREALVKGCLKATE
jgi:hypothetical protein